MRIYNILTKSSPTDVVFVEEKFSFIAFVFQGFWLLFYGIWPQAIVFLLAKYGIFMAIKNNYVNGSFGFGIDFILAIIVAIFAKTWYIEKLKKDNHKLHSVIIAKNLDEAKLRFYHLIMDTENVRQE